MAITELPYDSEAEGALCAEYAEWHAAQGLPEGDAMDMVFLDLTAEQRAWASDFILRWEAMLAVEKA